MFSLSSAFPLQGTMMKIGCFRFILRLMPCQNNFSISYSFKLFVHIYCYAMLTYLLTYLHEIRRYIQSLNQSECESLLFSQFIIRLDDLSVIHFVWLVYCLYLHKVSFLTVIWCIFCAPDCLQKYEVQAIKCFDTTSCFCIQFHCSWHCSCFTNYNNFDQQCWTVLPFTHL